MITYIINHSTIIKECLQLFKIKYKVFDNNNKIEICANKIEPFSKFLSESKRDVNLGINILIDLITQTKHYEKNRKTVPFIHFNNIIVVNNDNFLLIDPIFYSISNHHIKITETYSKNHEFLCDELINNTILPTHIHYKCIYQSIALIILKIIFDSTNTANMTKITYTRLSWCLQRCLNTHLEDRDLIYF